MLRAAIRRLRDWWAVDDPEERIVGSGEPIREPAYNGRYTAERRLDSLAAAAEESESDDE